MIPSSKQALDVEGVDPGISRAPDRRARVAARGPIGDADHLEVADVVVKPSTTPPRRVINQQVAGLVTSPARCWARSVLMVFGTVS